MSTKIRLVRLGKKKVPFYRIIVADSRSPRNGKTIEQVGTYNPALSDDAKLVLKNDLIKEWISRGAVLSQTVRELLEGKGLFEAVASPKAKPKKRKNRGNAMAAKIELRKEKEALEKKKLAALKKKEKEAALLASESAKAEEKAPVEAVAVEPSSVESEKQEVPEVVEDKKE